MDTGKVLLGILAGAAAGAFVGLLLAPEKGSVTRENITRKGGDYARNLKQNVNEFLDSIIYKLENAKEQGDSIADTVKSKAGESVVS